MLLYLRADCVLCNTSVQHINVALQAVLRPWRLNDVVTALVAQGIKGLTVSDVYGIGFQGGVLH